MTEERHQLALIQKRKEEKQGGWASEHTHTGRQGERESTPKTDVSFLQLPDGGRTDGRRAEVEAQERLTRRKKREKGSPVAL